MPDNNLETRLGLGGNNPPDAIAQLRERLEETHTELMARCNQLLAMAERLPSAADMDDDWEAKISEAIKSCTKFDRNCDVTRLAANEPHRALIAATDGFFKGMSDKVAALKAKLAKDYLTPYQQQKKDAEKARRDAEALEAKRRQEEELRLAREEQARLAEAKRREREAQEAIQRAEREAREAEEKRQAAVRAAEQRAERERKQAEAKAAAEARAERDRIERERMEAERRQREATDAAEREAAAAAKAEADRKAAAAKEEADRKAVAAKAEADRRAAEAKRKADEEAAAAKAAADRRAAEAKAAAEKAEAERKEQERQTKLARESAQKAADEKAIADKAASAKAAEMSRIRTDLGAVASLRTTWQFTVEDADKVPRLYLSVNEGAIRAAIKGATTPDNKCSLTIPGVVIYPKTESVVR